MAETEHRNYPLPEPENDVADDVYLLRQALQLVDGDVHALLQAISGLAPTVHTHEISGVNGLTAALAGKAASEHAHGLDDLTDVQSAGATPGSILYMGPSSQWIVGDPASVLGSHQHMIANVEGLQGVLDEKLAASGLPAALVAYTTKATPVDADTFLGFDSAASNAPKRFSWLNIKNTLKTLFDTLYAGISHTHTFASLTSKPTTRSGYGITDAAASSHNHAWADINSGKPTTLAGYGIIDAASSSHGHSFASLSSKPTTLDGYGITDAIETGARDSITNWGFASNNPANPYFRRASDGIVYYLQRALGFPAVQQGTGVGQDTNIIKIGHSGGGPRLTVDATDFGPFAFQGWVNSNFASKDPGHGGVGSYKTWDGNYSQNILVTGAAIGEAGTWRTQGPSWQQREGSSNKQLFFRVG